MKMVEKAGAACGNERKKESGGINVENSWIRTKDEKVGRHAWLPMDAE